MPRRRCSASRWRRNATATRTACTPATLAPLGVGVRSSEGLYDLALDVGPGERYVGRARARADGSQAHDSACAEISLHVEQGFATLGPTPRCWAR